MTREEEQNYYAVTQHSLCCKYLDVAEPFDGDGDTLSEAVITLKKDRDEWKEEAEMRSKETDVWKHEVSLLREELKKTTSALEDNITTFIDLREKLANVIYDLADERALADRLGNALEQCAEDSEELLGERAWWAMEKRCRYQERYLETVGNKERALLAIKAWKEARHGKA